MKKITTFIKLCLSARDTWDALEPTAAARSRFFADFCRWVMKMGVLPADGTPSTIKQLLLYVTDGNDYSTYEPSQLLAKLSLAANGQYYRVALAVDIKQNDDDRRVRDVFEHTVKNEELLNHSHLVCPFFTDMGFSRTKPQPRANYAYITSPTTRFEQLLFISVLVEMNKAIAEERPRKKRKLDSKSGQASSSTTPILGLKTLRGENASRIGFAIQQVVKAWDAFAHSYGFQGFEMLCLPYIQLSSETLQFRVIQSRSEGYPLVSEAKRFTLMATLTHLESNTFPNVCTRSDALDESLRTLSTDFFQDIQAMTHAPELFFTASNVVWNGFDRYKVPTQGIPARFSNMPIRMMSTVRQEIRQEMLSTPRASTTDATMDATTGVQKSSRNEDSAPVRPQRPPAETPYPLPAEAQSNASRIGTNQQMKEKVDMLENALKPFLRMYDAGFDEIIDLEDLSAPMDPLSSGGAQLLLCDPPYNTRRRSGKKNSDHDYLSMADMDQMVRVAAKVLRKGGHGIIFCSIQQYPHWVQKFSDATTKLPRNQTMNTFSVDSVPLHVERHPSVVTVPPGGKCALVNSVEYAVHIKKNGLLYQEEFTMVNYKNFNYVASTFPAFRNVINNVMWLLPGEQLRSCGENGDNSPSKSFALRAEQKPVALLKELICRFTQPGDVVVDLFAGTFATAHACMTLPQHRRFVGCEIDKACFTIASSHVLRRTASAIATRETDIKLQPEALPLAHAVHENYAPPELTDKNWNSPKGMPPFQKFPDHIMSLLGSIWADTSFFTTCLHKPINKWPRTYQGLFEQVDTKQLLYVDATVNGVFLAPSTIKHQMAGKGVFASKTFQEGDTICAYYGTLVYHDLGKRKRTAKKYGGGILGVDIHRYNKFALQLKTRGNGFTAVKDLLNGRKAICVVPSSFTAGAYLNDARYHHDDEEYEAHRQGQLSSPRYQNAILAESTIPSHPSELVHPDVLFVKATRYIGAGSEIFVNYGSEEFVYYNAAASSSSS